MASMRCTVGELCVRATGYVWEARQTRLQVGEIIMAVATRRVPMIFVCFLRIHVMMSQDASPGNHGVVVQAGISKHEIDYACPTPPPKQTCCQQTTWCGGRGVPLSPKCGSWFLPKSRNLQQEAINNSSVRIVRWVPVERCTGQIPCARSPTYHAGMSESSRCILHPKS